MNRSSSRSRLKVLYLTNGVTVGSTGRILQHWLQVDSAAGVSGALVVRPGSEYAAWGRQHEVPTLVDPMPNPDRRRPWSILWHAARVARWARRVGVQVIHCNEHDVYPFAAVLRKWLRVPVVCHVRYRLTRGFAVWAFGGKRCPDALLWTSYQQQADSAAAIDGVVPTEKQHILRLGVDLADIGKYEQSGRELRRKLGVADGELLIGMPSPLRPRKRVEDFIAIIARLTDQNHGCVGLIAGQEVPGDEEYRARIERLIAESGKGRRLRWVGYLSPVEPFHHACDISVSTSEYETFGNSVCEAMACGKPVAAYRGGAVAEVLGDAGLVVETGEVDALAQAIERLIEDSGLRRTLGDRARARVGQDFNPARSLAQVRQIYNQLGVQ